MMEWVYLASAIAIEIASTVALRVATSGRPRWYVVVVTGYTVSFLLLSLALREGLGIGVAYGIWTAVGVAITAVLSHRLFGERLSRTMVVGIALIAVGVVLLELGQT